ncbi:hypothetical protein Curi_c28220 [Gottschalkia acidurici 9a]|uniref:Uncharacterized protein n=1 Tax=Gottschalkia acidurici (strain ATCC 7906 / DSM 604 / BCRC 14475 / CIP 104303 / KCTC 5404 / NCIMB 10678 / 9a) TaxID=1128398 RepID=K0B2W1_GOTA9|nr:hypothetical protein [Gottschalkia acidurici]AFS79814.1 hypothetical protein Curi_c28220 [Gottschalkia acidurici 9a]
MFKIGHVRDIKYIQKNLPEEVIKVIKDVATILDTEYGECRDIDYDIGGYILIIESKDEFKKLKDIHIDINDTIYEYVDRIKVENNNDWINALILCNNDFGVSIIMPIPIVPEKIIDSIVD